MLHIHSELHNFTYLMKLQVQQALYAHAHQEKVHATLRRQQVEEALSQALSITKTSVKNNDSTIND